MEKDKMNSEKDIRPTKEQKKLGREDGWGTFEVNHGYGIFQEGDDEHPLDVICRIDVMDVFDGDLEAVEQAKRDGYKFLDLGKGFNTEMINVLPQQVLDTEDNRKNIEWYKSTDESMKKCSMGKLKEDDHTKEKSGKDIRPTEAQMELGREDDWGDFEVEHGYGIFEDGHPDYPLEVICRIDVMDVFPGDLEACEQAKRDGYKFLELAKDFDTEYFNVLPGQVLDTEKNRENIKKYDKATVESLGKNPRRKLKEADYIANGEPNKRRLSDYEFKMELTDAQKARLSEILFNEEDDVDLSKDFVIVTDYTKDPDFDDREKMFWDKGEEYPFPYILLIGGQFYDALAPWVVDELRRVKESLTAENIDLNEAKEGQSDLFGYVNGDLKDFDPKGLVDKVKERGQSLHTNRMVVDTDNEKICHHIVVEALGWTDGPNVWVDVVEERWTRNSGYDADDIRSYQGKMEQDRILMKDCGVGEAGFEKAIKELEKYKADTLRKYGTATESIKEGKEETYLEVVKDDENGTTTLDTFDLDEKEEAIAHAKENGGTRVLKVFKVENKDGSSEFLDDKEEVIWEKGKEEALKEADEDDLSDDELDALDAEEEKAFRQKQADRRARIAGNRKDKEAKKAKSDELLSKIGDDWSIDHLSEVIVPVSGRAQTKAGELVRAVTNLDEDEPFWTGEGLRGRNGSYVEFIHKTVSDLNDGDKEDKLADSIISEIEECCSDAVDGDKYTGFVKKLGEDVAMFVKEHQELLGEANEEDSGTDVDADSYFGNGGLSILPEFSIEDCELPPELKEFLELEVIDSDDIEWHIQDIIMELGNSTQDVHVYNDQFVDVNGLSKDDFDALGGEEAKALYDFLEEYADQLEMEHGSPDEIRSKKEAEESEDDDSTDESLARRRDEIWSKGSSATKQEKKEFAMIRRKLGEGFYTKEITRESVKKMAEASAKMYVYQFPPLDDKDIEVAKTRYGLEYLGKQGPEGFQPGDPCIKGTLKQLRKYCDDYLGYMMHPDYLCPEDSFDDEYLVDDDVFESKECKGADCKEPSKKDSKTEPIKEDGNATGLWDKLKDVYNDGRIYFDIVEKPEGGEFLIFDDWDSVIAVEKALDANFNPKDKWDDSVLTRMDIEYGFDDEWGRCDSCGKLIRTAPNSYSWKPDFFFDEDGIECGDCVRKNPEDYLRWLLDDPAKRANTILTAQELENAGFTKIDEKYENGWYDRHDKPEEILAKAQEEHPEAEFIFNIDGNAQFATYFSLWMRGQAE